MNGGVNEVAVEAKVNAEAKEEGGGDGGRRDESAEGEEKMPRTALSHTVAEAERATQHDERRNHLGNEASTRARPCPACEQRGPGRPAAAKRGELTMKSSSCWSSEPSGACGIESSSGE